MEIKAEDLAGAKRIRIEFDSGDTFEGRIGTDDYGWTYVVEDNGESSSFNVVPIIDGAGDLIANPAFDDVASLTVLERY